MNYMIISCSFVRSQIVLSKSTSKNSQKFSVIKTNTSDDIKKYRDSPVSAVSISAVPGIVRVQNSTK